MNFDQAQSLYAELRRSLDAGTITPATFSERVMELRRQDEQGNWWQVDAQSGGWLRWNGQAWVSAQPPPATPSAPAMGAAGTPQNLLQYLLFVGRQMVAGYLKRLPLMLALAAGIWVLHTYWLVFVNDGFAKNPSNFFLKNLILLTGSKVQAAVAWGLLGMVVSTLVCRCYRKGIAPAIRELVCWPEAARRALAGGGPRGMSLFLVACAVALAISGWLSNPLAALLFAFMFSLGLLDRNASPFFLGVWFGWNDLDRTLLKGKVAVPSAAAAAAVIVLGAAAGFLLGGFLPKLLLNIGCVVVLIVAFAGKFRTPASGGAGRLLLLLFLLVLPTLCWGHDGGWSESGATFNGWIHNQGFAPAVLLGFWPASLGSFFGILPWVMPLSGPNENPATIYGTGTKEDPYRDSSAFKINPDGTIGRYAESTTAPTIYGTGTSSDPYSDTQREPVSKEPASEPPKTEPPKTEPPKTEPPKTEPPQTEPPKKDTPKEDTTATKPEDKPDVTEIPGKIAEGLGTLGDNLGKVNENIKKLETEINEGRIPLTAEGKEAFNKMKERIEKFTEKITDKTEKWKESLEGAQGVIDKARSLEKEVNESLKNIEDFHKEIKDIQMDGRSHAALSAVLVGAEGAGRTFDLAVRKTLGDKVADTLGAKELGKDAADALAKTVKNITKTNTEIEADPELHEMAAGKQAVEDLKARKEGLKKQEDYFKQKDADAEAAKKKLESFHLPPGLKPVYSWWDPRNTLQNYGLWH